MKITEVREGLMPLLDKLGNEVDHFEMLEMLETRSALTTEGLHLFNTDFSEIATVRKELPKILAEIRVLSDILVFKLSMHMGDFEKALDGATQAMIDEISTSDENYGDMDF